MAAGAILIYGATGYTGRLAAREAAARGLAPLLAGRGAAKVRAVAEPLGLPWRAFALDDATALDGALRGVATVLCAAGPFSATSKPMADACLRNRVHYLDITGEIDVFEALAARDAEAKAAGVMLLPGVGFDVVPSDCLAAHLKRRLPDAADLKLFLSIGNNASRGTAKTMIEGVAAGARIRRAGRIVRVARVGAGSCDFGAGERRTLQVGWGDVSTAWRSTGIPDIEVHFESSRALESFVRIPRIAGAFLGLGFMQAFLKSRVDARPEGPSDEVRRAGRCVLVGVARNRAGAAVRTRLTTPEGYTLTARTAVDAALRTAAGEAKPGFQTPSLAFGADYILGFDAVAREDVDA